MNQYLQPFKNERKISFFNNKQEILELDELTGENIEHDNNSVEIRKNTNI